jgi:hypothetical protein
MPGGKIFSKEYAVGATPGPLIGFPVQYTLLVDPANPQASDSTSIEFPFITIQAAVSAIGAPADLNDQKQRFSILIAPGEYDEDVSVQAGRRIAFIPLGPVTLGDGTVNANYASTTPRNLTVDCTPAFGGRATFAIGTIIGDEVHGTKGAQTAAMTISGNIVFTGAPTIAEAATVRLSTIYVYGNIDGTTLSSIGVDLHINKSRIDGTCGGTNVALFQASGADLRGLGTFLFAGNMIDCSINAGLTVAAAPNFQGAAGFPPGMYSCYFAGTFTGPAATCWMDAATNFWFKTNGAALAGGATKVILGDLVP